LGERDPTFFYVDLWSRLLELQIHGEAMSAEAPGTTNDRKKQPMTFELRPSTGAAGGRDAHWADPTSLELLDLIVERAPSLPLLAPGAVDWLTKVAAEMASTPTQRRSVH
jgi:hypothetical protein